jgi:glutathione S-transferase
MHAGFGALREHFPMNLEASLPDVGRRVLAEQAQARSDLERIERMWSERLAASGGPMLYGAFGAIDAYYAPVGMRIRTYGLPVSQVVADYVARISALPAVQAWIDAALVEHDFVAEDEPYRQRPDAPVV